DQGLEDFDPVVVASGPPGGGTADAVQNRPGNPERRDIEGQAAHAVLLGAYATSGVICHSRYRYAPWAMGCARRCPPRRGRLGTRAPRGPFRWAVTLPPPPSGTMGRDALCSARASRGPGRLGGHRVADQARLPGPAALPDRLVVHPGRGVAGAAVHGLRLPGGLQRLPLPRRGA